MAIPYALGGVSELFISVPAYGIAYSRAPENMRGLVSALASFSTAIAYILGLVCSSIIRDPYLTWDFGGPSIVGGILTIVFYFMFRHIDKEEFILRRNGESNLNLQETEDIATAGDFEKTLEKTPSLTQIAAEHAELVIGSK